MFLCENMQDSSVGSNWKIKEMDAGHGVWLILVGQSDCNESLRKGDVQVSFWVRPVCLTGISGYLH